MAYWLEDGRVEELDFVPTYDKQDELEGLFKKATEGSGLTPEEWERLNWLTEDKKYQVNKQVREWVESEKSK
ncbi:hypothetical protein [Thiogranum longum]|nr:hypothetical protein [Thiogranum longum]